MQLSMTYYQFFPCTLISCTWYLISVLAFIHYPPKTLWWLIFLVFVVVVGRMFFHLNQIYLHSMTVLLPYCIHTEYRVVIKYLLHLLYELAKFDYIIEHYLYQILHELLNIFITHFMIEQSNNKKSHQGTIFLSRINLKKG